MSVKTVRIAPSGSPVIESESEETIDEIIELPQMILWDGEWIEFDEGMARG